jgi:hypothetical protein
MNQIFQYIERIIKYAAIAYTIYSLIQFADVVNHAYISQKEKISSAQTAFQKLCDDGSLLSWPAIIDNCIHYRQIGQRNVYWETVVEASHHLKPCGSNKNYHNENHGLSDHAHVNEDGEGSCNYLYVLGFGIAIGALFIIGVFNKRKNINNKIKNE